MNIEEIKKAFSKKYRFIKLLGKGGFAEVYLAEDILLERKVAIKILLTEHTNEPEMVKRFLREARLYAKLEHKNLINIYDTGIISENAFIVMKYIKGKSLKDYISADRRTRDKILPVLIKNMGSVLSYIHKNGIIHRDIKPANILIEDGTNRIYLADFGIARSVSSKTLTQSGSIMGTPYYISPEQIKGSKIDSRADIYALGATLYEFISGKPIFTAESSIEILYKHVNSQPEPIGKLAPHLSKEIKYIVSRCLEKNPDKRFKDASEIESLISGRKSEKITKYLETVESGNSKIKKVFLSLAIIIISLFSIYYFLQKDKENGGEGKTDNIGVTKTVKSGDEKRGVVQSKDKRVESKNDVMGNSSRQKVSADLPVKNTRVNSGNVEKEKGRKSSPEIRNVTKRRDLPPDDNTPVSSVAKEKAEKKGPGKILFSSFPASDVYWNGIKLGNTTQIFSKEFPPGTYTFSFRIPGYKSGSKSVEVFPGKDTNVHYKFKPYGYLTLMAKPFAKFIINGVDYGENPIFKKKFPVGTYFIKAVKPGYITMQKTVEIKSMKKQFVSFTMKKEEKK